MGLEGTRVVAPAEDSASAWLEKPWMSWVPAPCRKTTPGVGPVTPTGRRRRAGTCSPSAWVMVTVEVSMR